MAARRRAGAAAQHELPTHELAIILADRTLDRAEAGIGPIGAPRPFPDVAEKGGVAGTCRPRLDRARRDLELFLLQKRLDPMLARAGRELLGEVAR